MTDEDMATEIGRAFQERKRLDQEITCLRYRLRTVGNAATVLSENHLNEEAEKGMESASDIRHDFAELRKACSRLVELDRILKN